ncbi:hypothetical protein RI367_001793 [Sorochytrium milnesiophthora]
MSSPRDSPSGSTCRGRIHKLKQDSIDIRLSYSTWQYVLHTTLLLVTGGALLSCLSNSSWLVRPSLSHHNPAPLLIGTSRTGVWLSAANSALNRSLRSILSVSPESTTVDTLSHMELALLLQFFYLAASLIVTLVYAPLLEKIVHIYLIWPLTGLVICVARIPFLSSAICAWSPLAAVVDAAGEAAAQPSTSPRLWTMTRLGSCLPLAVSITYHLFLRRHLVTIRLWQHLHSFPHLHAIHSASSSSFAAPSIHPARFLSSRIRQVCYRLYSLVSPYCFELLCVQLGLILPHQRRIGPLLCLCNWALVRLYISFHCFQIESVAWLKHRIGREGIIIWRERQRGLKSTGSPILTVFVSSENNIATERRFDKQLTLTQLKAGVGKLEPITGIPASAQLLKLYNGEQFLAQLSAENKEDSVMLGAFPIENFMTIHVANTGTQNTRNQFTDLSLVEKYEMKDDKYDQLQDTVRDFKRRNKMGRFDDARSATSNEGEMEAKFEELAKAIKVGDRCEVDLSGAVGDTGEDGSAVRRRGTVKFVGQTQFKPGTWIGVQYDEPLGKHDGTVQGVAYFSCPPKHGSFVRPDKITVGDFPEEDPFADMDEI